MNGLVIALDFDGVMYPLTTALSRWCATTGRPDPVPADCHTYRFWHDTMTDVEWSDLLCAFGEADGYRLAAPYPDAVIGVSALFDAGCGLLGVTSRPPTPAVVRSTYGFVADNYLPLRSVHIGPDAKLEAEFDLIVDDNPVDLARVEELAEASGLLLARPYNVDAERPRVSWEELPTLVDAVAGQLVGVSDSDRRDALAEALDEMLAG